MIKLILIWLGWFWIISLIDTIFSDILLYFFLYNIFVLTLVPTKSKGVNQLKFVSCDEFFEKLLKKLIWFKLLIAEHTTSKCNHAWKTYTGCFVWKNDFIFLFITYRGSYLARETRYREQLHNQHFPVPAKTHLWIPCRFHNLHKILIQNVSKIFGRDWNFINTDKEKIMKEKSK